MDFEDEDFSIQGDPFITTPAATEAMQFLHSPEGGGLLSVQRPHQMALPFSWRKCHPGAHYRFPILFGLLSGPYFVSLLVMCGDIWASQCSLWFPIVSTISYVSTVVMLLLSVIVDPGVIPPGPLDAARPTYIPPIRLPDGELEAISKWCTACRIIRPVRSAHCRYCGWCVQEFDHHCGVTGCCVGKGSLKYFISFYYSVAVFATSVFAQSCYMVVTQLNGDAARWTAALSLLVYSMVFACQLHAGSCVYTYLACSGLTMREHRKKGSLYVNGSLQGPAPMPFSKGPFQNCAHVMCGT